MDFFHGFKFKECRPSNIIKSTGKIFHIYTKNNFVNV